MNLADVSTVVLVIVGLLVTFVAWWLAMAGLFPRVVENCAEKLGAAPLTCTAIGLACAVPLIFGAIAVGNAVPSAAGNLLRAVILLGVIFSALTGAAGIALRIGRGLSGQNEPLTPLRRMLRGGVVLALSYLPVIWLPLSLLAGLGAIVRVWLTRRTHTASV